MSEKYFIKCDTCGEKIYLGQLIYKYSGYCGCYCSGECFAQAYADAQYLDLEEVENSNCELFKEEEITTTKITKLDEADVLILKNLK